jgi:hypothetical protein
MKYQVDVRRNGELMTRVICLTTKKQILDWISDEMNLAKLYPPDKTIEVTLTISDESAESRA